jgi:hypothetical protein
LPSASISRPPATRPPRIGRRPRKSGYVVAAGGGIVVVLILVMATSPTFWAKALW